MTLNIIAKTFFGRDTEIDSRLVKDILTAMGWSMVLTLIPLGNLVARLPLGRNRQRDRAIEAMDRVVHNVIKKVHAEPEGRTELVWWLVHAEDEEGIDRALSNAEVRDESYAMLLAGHETSANALTWCFYYLSRNPAVRARLEAEVDEVLGGRPPTMEDCDRSPYTRAAFARMETVLALSAITQRWRIEVISDEHPEVLTMGIYRCKNGLPCTVHARQPSSS